MSGPGNCTICTKEFNERSRKQMLICLSQHCICLSCADQIAEKDSKCPYCKKLFDIKQIQPRRLQRKLNENIRIQNIKTDIELSQQKKQLYQNDFCPFGHKSWKYQNHSYSYSCNNCQKIKNSFRSCNSCRYKQCVECEKIRYDVNERQRLKQKNQNQNK